MRSREKFSAAAAFYVAGERAHRAFALGGNDAAHGACTGERRARVETRRFDFRSGTRRCAITRTIGRTAASAFDARIAARTGRRNAASSARTARPAVSTRARRRFCVDYDLATTAIKSWNGQRYSADEHHSRPLHDAAS